MRTCDLAAFIALVVACALALYDRAFTVALVAAGIALTVVPVAFNVTG